MAGDAKKQTSPLSFPCNQINLMGWDACLSYDLLVSFYLALIGGWQALFFACKYGTSDGWESAKQSCGSRENRKVYENESN